VQEPYESLIDRQVRLAAERGDFDDLPGAGKPLPALAEPDDELWWVRGYLRREGLSTEALLPPAVQLRKEVDRLPEALRELPTEQAVRDAVRELNRRIAEFLRAPTGPRIPVRPVDLEAAVRRWHEGRPQRPAGTPAPVAPEPAPEPAPSRVRWWRRSRRR
jgi:DnaJ-like protein